MPQSQRLDYPKQRLNSLNSWPGRLGCSVDINGVVPAIRRVSLHNMLDVVSGRSCNPNRLMLRQRVAPRFRNKPWF